MLYKIKKTRWSLVKYVAAFLLIGCTSLFVASCGRQTTPSASSQQPASKSANDEGFSSVEQASTYNGEPIFTVVQQQPEFPGGVQAMYKFLAQNVKYPSAAARANVTGRVFTTFVITKEGEIKDITVLKGVGFGIDEEAIRVISAMPRWRPGKQDGKPVHVRFRMPIAFEMGKGKS